MQDFSEPIAPDKDILERCKCLPKMFHRKFFRLQVQNSRLMRGRHRGANMAFGLWENM